MPLLSAVLIVKNESASIAKVIKTASQFVDAITVLDTGSEDGTQDIIRNEFPFVHLFEEKIEPWNFSVARNRVAEIDAALPEPALFQLSLNADEYLRGGDKIREHLEQHRDSDVDCHWVRVIVPVDDASSFQPRILRTGSAWKCEGAIHEVPYNRANPDAKKAHVEGDCSIEHVVSDLERRFSNIWENHIPTLKGVLEENPADDRALIFLAQSYGGLLGFMPPYEVTTYGMEAMSYLLRRLAVNTGTDAERNHCEMMYLDIARMTGVYTDEEVFARCEALAKKDPNRPDTQVLYAYAAMRVRPAPFVYPVAANAAYVAMKVAEEITNDSPVSTSACWRAHLLAAMCAKKIAEKYPVDDNGKPWMQIAREHVDAGVAAGGPQERFASIANSLDGAVQQVMQVTA